MATPTLENSDRIEVPDAVVDLPADEVSDGSPEPGELPEVTGSGKSTCRENPRSSWHVLRKRNFRLYFMGTLISNLGTWMQSTAQVLIAYRVTHSVFTVGVIASAQFAGMVISPWAPVLANRFSPRSVLVGTQCLSALIAGMMAWRYHDGRLGVHSLLAGAFALGFAYALTLPVQTALVPRLVREEDTADAVKMNSVSYNAGRALAPALCVPVIIFIGPDLTFALNAISFLIFIIFLHSAGILRAGFNNAAARRSRARVRDGLLAALKRQRLLLLLAIVAAVTLGDDPITVLSPAVAARLHMPSASAGYLIAALGWGSVLGSLLPTAARDNDVQRASRRAAYCLLGLAASVLVFAAGFWFPLNILGAVAAGAAALFTGTAAQTALLRQQKKTGADIASVAALWAIAWAGTKPFASLLDGWLASHVGIVATSFALTLPAICIALCELLLSYKVKDRIINYGDRIATRLIRESISAASIDPGRELQLLPDATTLTGIPSVADRADRTLVPMDSEQANRPELDGACRPVTGLVEHAPA